MVVPEVAGPWVDGGLREIVPASLRLWILVWFLREGRCVRRLPVLGAFLVWAGQQAGRAR